MEAAFPTESESTVADALLLLCTSSSSSSSSSSVPFSLSFLSSNSPSCSSDDDEDEDDNERKPKLKSVEELSPSVLKSSSSSLTSDGSSATTGECQADGIQVVALAARLHDMKLKFQLPSPSLLTVFEASKYRKVVRRNRSKHYHNSRKHWSSSSLTTSSLITTNSMESSPDLSSASSSVHGAPRRSQLRRISGKRSVISCTEALIRQKFGSPCMKRRAEAILKFLSDGCSSEVKIREVLGDRPDTSKALRMLLKLEQVKRSGAGGRRDPFMYKVAGARDGIELA